MAGEPGRHGAGLLPELSVGEHALCAGVLDERHVGALGAPLGVPPERVHEGPRVGGHRGGLGWSGPRLERWRRRLRRGRGDRGNQVARRRRLDHRGVGQADAQVALDAEEQLHALEAADAKVPVEDIVEPWCAASTRATELAQ